MKLAHEYDWIIVGAGIIGSLTAWRLAQQGYHVALVDAGAPGQQATGAAAGILSPMAEATGPGAFTALMAHSLQRYPAMVEELGAESGMNVQYHASGVLQVAFSESERDVLKARFAWQRELGAQWLEGRELGAVEPRLADFPAAIYGPVEGQVHPPLLVQAAVHAALARGVHSWFGEPVRSLSREGDRIQGVSLPTEDLWARGGVIVTAGAWSRLVVDALDQSLPLRPVRGQILSLTLDEPIFRHIVFHGHTYAVPKRDGRLIIGATEDEGGFDSRVTAGGLARLTQVMDLFGLASHTVFLERVWAGLRPKTADGLPVLGAWPGLPGLYMATGHYRNGVLLSAVTADIAVGWATHNAVSVDVSPFRPDRFWKDVVSGT